MPWRGPEYAGEMPTLGWGILEWVEKDARLLVPDGIHAGDPLTLTDEQAELLLKFYAIGERGGYVYRRAAVMRPKGWGKSPLLGIIALAELAGPTVFSHWDEFGEPVGKVRRVPLVQIAAVSEDQTGNTYSAIMGMAKDSRLNRENGGPLDIGLTRIFTPDGGKLEPVTASASSRAGGRVTFWLEDETWLWTPRNGGVKLASAGRANVTKMGGRSFESTNAPIPGEGSVAEMTMRAGGAPGVLFSGPQAPEVDDLKDRPALVRALAVAYGDSAVERGGWVDLEGVADNATDPATDEDEYRRLFLNQPKSAKTKYVDVNRWLGLATPDRTVEVGSYVGLGFDGSVNDDSTTLYGCTVDGFIFEVASWERPRDQVGNLVTDWKVPRLDVHDAIALAFSTYRVGRFYFDPPKWWTEGEHWARLYGDEVVLALDTFKESRFAPACGRFAADIKAGRTSHDGRGGLVEHLAATKKKWVRLSGDAEDGRRTFVIEKEDTRKIDRAIAATLAYEAAMTMPPPESNEVNIW